MVQSLSRSDTDFLIRELTKELDAKPDGAGKNLIARCPCCGKEGKYGIYIGKQTLRKKPFMSHCFSCGYSTFSLEALLDFLGRQDLMVTPTTDLDTRLATSLLFPLEEGEEIDDALGVVELPGFYRRCFTHPYLKARGFTFDDYEYFQVGTTRGLNFRYDAYVIFPVIDEGDIVGYVSRHTWSKDEIDRHNSRVSRKGGYRILRFRNSTENDFVKLLYNYDAVVEGVTQTVIITEGIFDVIALTRKKELYDNESMAAVATFGKKISRTQIYKLQAKGVKTVILGYDGDAVEAIKKTAGELNAYFRVLIADIPDAKKDWEDLSREEIDDIFSHRLRTPAEYRLLKVQE